MSRMLIAPVVGDYLRLGFKVESAGTTRRLERWASLEPPPIPDGRPRLSNAVDFRGVPNVREVEPLGFRWLSDLGRADGGATGVGRAGNRAGCMTGETPKRDSKRSERFGQGAPGWSSSNPGEGAGAAGRAEGRPGRDRELVKNRAGMGRRSKPSAEDRENGPDRGAMQEGQGGTPQRAR
jgi:hypothetical protein